MQYLCLIYGDERSMATQPKAEMDAMISEFAVFTGDVKKNGQYVGANRLQPTHTATTVRVRNGKVSATDGPFAETKEQLGGYYLIEAKDLNDAIQVASRIPSARTGAVEVRPVAMMGQP